ncbi:sulfite exporter TauE/SafE family protein [Sandaracinobacteroides saxicola]|uniref:Probable membrane transporter protein n=1 Tax=Sandaracinobacteroides saxicola TaxID=2759707 RepID=A0A7G5IEL0_9SPHN|nr:sulfite exporter TauE/SafE family protein [Sandaracinobacteroides saxicola]QMW21802.1 sulfite exporter TauE/SafE family protein [Sandaracinobacteroides saxicola]
MIDPALLLLFAAGLWAGAQNALAGGGSFVTLPALMAAGLDAKTANLTTTLALFPGQLTTGYAGRHLVTGTQRLSFRALAGIALLGGTLGAAILLLTPAPSFAAMLPWLVLLATLIFAWSAFRKPATATPLLPREAESGESKTAHSASGDSRDSAAGVGARPYSAPVAPPPLALTVALQFLIAVYCGFFGGGAGFVMLASLTLARMPVRNAAGTKNVLVALSNSAAAPVLALSGAVAWDKALILGTGAILGGWAGAKALSHIPDKPLKLLVILIGTLLFIGLLVWT